MYIDDDDEMEEMPSTLEQFRESFELCKETLEELKARRNNVKVHAEVLTPEKMKVYKKESTPTLVFVFSTRIISVLLFTLFAFSMLIYTTKVKQF